LAQARSICNFIAQLVCWPDSSAAPCNSKVAGRIRGIRLTMTPRPCNLRPQSVVLPCEHAVQNERMLDDLVCEAFRYRTHAPKSVMPRPPPGDYSPAFAETSRSRRDIIQQADDSFALALRSVSHAAEEDCEVLAAHDLDCMAHLAVFPEVDDELNGAGGGAPDKYQLNVCLGDRIPLETGAARVNASRVETGQDWRAFLIEGSHGRLCDGLSLDEHLQCPCCLGVLRRPVALPCGHTLCRGCLMRLPCPSTGDRQCPLCRAPIPRVRLHVNEQLDAVTEALHVLHSMTRTRAQQGVEVIGARKT